MIDLYMAVMPPGGDNTPLLVTGLVLVAAICIYAVLARGDRADRQRERNQLRAAARRGEEDCHCDRG